MITELRILLQSFLFFALTFGPMLVYARHRHDKWVAEYEACATYRPEQLPPRETAGELAIVIAIYLALFALGFGAAMLAFPNAVSFFR